VLRNIQADGLDLDPIAGVVSNIIVYGYATEAIHKASLVVDALLIKADSDAYVKEIVIDGMTVKGDIILERLKVDEIIVENAIIGEDGSLTTSDLILDANVEELVIENVVETLVKVT